MEREPQRSSRRPADKIPDFNPTQHMKEQSFILPAQHKTQQWLHAHEFSAYSVSVWGIPVAILVQARRYCSSWSRWPASQNPQEDLS